MKRSTINIFAVIMLLALLITGCQVEKQPTKIGDIGVSDQTSNEETPHTLQEVIYEVGDIVSINNAVLVILGWDQPPGGDFNPPDEGKKYLVVDLMIANQGERSFNSSPVFQMTLKDPSGQKYNINGKANIASGSNTPNGEVNPGEVIRGKVGFHVPEDLTNFIFVYEANLMGIGEVSVIEISGLVIQLLGVSYLSGTDFVKPKEDYKFVSVDVQVENQGDSVQEITSIVQMYLKDNTGEKYTFHLGAQSIIDSGLPDDELQPGERIRGQIGFQVPTDSAGLIFVFDAEIFGFGKIFIALD